MSVLKRARSASLTRAAYDRIYGRIASGRIAEGAVLSEAALAAQLGISRTPVNGALRRLASEGLVEQVPRYGTVVRRFDPQELGELYEMREALESFAAMAAASRIGEHALARLARYCDEMARIGEELEASRSGELDGSALRRFLAADLAFHLLVVEAAGNRSIARVVAQTRATSRLLRLRRARHDASVVAQTCAQHRRIASALARRDGEAARRLTAEHIRESRERTLRELGREPSAPGEDGGQLTLPAELQADLDALERDCSATPRRGRPALRRTGR